MQGIHPAHVTGVIFCGGKSQRMGRDKALLELSGESLLQRVARTLEPHVSQVVLSTGSSVRYSTLGLDCWLDLEEGLGPIGGLQAALTSSETPWILAAACDLPGLNSQGVNALLSAVRSGDLAVLFGSAGQPEPLFALYHRDLLPRVESAIRSGQRRMISALGLEESDPAPVRWVNLEADVRSKMLFNVNHPEDWCAFQGNRSQAHPTDL
ncbi:MAG: molybdenum cofactor guanylyltransferase [Planctomycetes bacterium]|nr:molybdenum cofactor guanylyltransferase [Planctomycetota bacterium]